MNIPYTGELAAIATAICWTVGVTLYDAISKRTSTFVVNLVKVVIALTLLSACSFFITGSFFPRSIPREAWLFLAVSGLVGFVIGDLFLFRSFAMVGARTSMIVYSLTPALAALGGWILLGERLTLFVIIGMAVTLSGIMLVVLRKSDADTGAVEHRIIGVVFAFIATVCQAAGYLASKQVMRSMTPIEATEARLAVAVIGFAVVLLIAGKLVDLTSAVRDGFIMPRLIIASVFGPFIGVTLSMVALHAANAGVVTTIMAMTPVLLIVPALFRREKLGIRDVLGAVLAVGGIAMFFIK
ncbi:MAG: DMT family transporter [Spirochaetota bacterium]